MENMFKLDVRLMLIDIKASLAAKGVDDVREQLLTLLRSQEFKVR